MDDIEKLIARVRSYPPVAEWEDPGEADGVIWQLTTALEAEHKRAEAERERAGSVQAALDGSRGVARGDNEYLIARAEKAEAECDALRSVVKKARDVEESSYHLATGRWPDKNNSSATWRILSRAAIDAKDRAMTDEEIRAALLAKLEREEQIVHNTFLVRFSSPKAYEESVEAKRARDATLRALAELKWEKQS